MANRGRFVSDERRSQIPRAPSPAAAPWSRRGLGPWPRTLAPLPRDPACPCVLHRCRGQPPPRPGLVRGVLAAPMVGGARPRVRGICDGGAKTQAGGGGAA